MTLDEVNDVNVTKHEIVNMFVEKMSQSEVDF